MSVATYQLCVLAPQLDELIDYFILTRLRPARDRRQAIMLGILAEMIEATITITRTPRRRRIYFVEIAKHSLDRCMHAVEIQAINARETVLRASLCIPCAQPFDEFDHDGVAPHPARETPKIAQRIIRVRVFAAAGYEPMDPECIRPIRLESDGAESFSLNQSLSELGPRFVELMRAMRRFADENALRLARHLHQRIIGGIARNRARCRADDGSRVLDSSFAH